MLPRTDIAGSRPLASVEPVLPTRTIGDARQELYSRLTQIAIGKTMMADVLSKLGDGTFLLKIADTAVKVALPIEARVGDQIPLKLMATDPRPTFLLTLENKSLVLKGSDTAQLSSAARIIGNALQGAQKDSAPTIVGKTPIVPSAQASPAQVAAGLKGTLAGSGVFYESHVQQWAAGQRPLAELMREPQAQAALAKSAALASLAQVVDLNESASAQTAKPGAPAAEARPELSKLIDIVTEWEPGQRTAAREEAAPTAKTTDTPRNAASTPATALLESLDAESAQRINLQLNTLEHNRVAWQGELWPGQKLEWEVSEDAPQPNSENPEKPTWTSVVRFELPTLGVISASIHLDGNHVRMQVKTTSDAAAAALRAHGDDLAGALDAAGSPLDLLTVKKHDDQA